MTHQLTATSLLHAIEAGSLKAVDFGDLMNLVVDDRLAAAIYYRERRPHATVGIGGLYVDVCPSLGVEEGFSVRCETREDAVRIAEALNACFGANLVDAISNGTGEPAGNHTNAR